VTAEAPKLIKEQMGKVLRKTEFILKKNPLETQNPSFILVTWPCCGSAAPSSLVAMVRLSCTTS